jgi:two-component system CheB/CheR fusion protein
MAAKKKGKNPDNPGPPAKPDGASEKQERSTAKADRPSAKSERSPEKSERAAPKSEPTKPERAAPKSEPTKPERTQAKPETARPEAAVITSQKPTEKHQVVVVGIGASAGGLESFKKFFDAMPSDSGLAFVLIQHLDPTHESMMVELLAKHTKMQVSQVTKETTIETNHVYIAPAGKYLGVRNRVLFLSEPPERRGLRMPIDHFFRSLAEDLRERAICIILSGTGTEGTLGLRAVKEQGGMGMVQDPASAPHESMPRSAISTNLVDFILPVEDMPDVLVRYAKHPYVDGPSKPEIAPKVPDHLAAILAVIKTRTHQDFRSYKKNTLTRRIERRMGLNHILDGDDYVEYLRGNQKEVSQLFKDLLIGVTGFFRESESWDALAQQVVPNLVSNCGTDAPIRLWVPGCSTGEEAYSLVMLLLEELNKQDKSCPIQVFATDIDEDALDFAREGVYPESIAADIPPERLRRFFSKVDDHNYKVSKPLREPVVFAVQNLIGDAPFSKLDLISCRNLLIYLESSVQQKVIALFHFGLKPGGYLFLGTSEGINRQETLFDPVSKKWQIYRRIGPSHPDRIEFPITTGAESAKDRRTLLEVSRRPSMAEVTQQTLLQEFAPATVLVNRKFEVLFLTGPTSQYLELPPGAPTLDVMTLAQEGLRGKLRIALAEAAKTEGRATARGARVKRDDAYVAVTVAVRPVKVPQQDESLLLVTFVDEPKAEREIQQSSGNQGASDYAQLRQLEHDLQTTREDLQSTIEELETSNEEMKVSNEEIMSMNEELQSTNEELETSKEELQSLNEELSTVNNQLQEKVSELEGTNNDMANLLANTDISTIFMDREFCIKRYTPPANQLFRLIPSDVGRPVSDVVSLIKNDSLVKDGQGVLDKLVPDEKEVQTVDGQYYLRRIVPYRTQDNRIDGVVVTFANVSPIKRSEESLKSLNETLEERVDQRTAMLELVQEVTRAANEADRIDLVIRWALERIGRFNEWPVGVAYLVHDGNASQLEPVEVWHVDDAKEYQDFIEAIRARRPVRGEVLPGLAWQKGELVTINDLARHSDFIRRAEAAALGLQNGLGFPILSRREVVGVLEFFSPNPIKPDPNMLSVLRTIGQQLGRVVERSRQQRELAQAMSVEQRHLGQDLHDTVSQELAGLAMLAKTVQNNLEKEKSKEAARLDELGVGLRTVADQVREIARGMFPVSIEPQALPAALAALAAKIEERYGIRCTFIEDSAMVNDGIVATHLFRIAQEAVTNAVKHGNAKNIYVTLRGNDPLLLRVTNDGRKFEPNKTPALGMGLRIMNYRADLIGATLDIDHKNGETVVSCTLPPPSLHPQP